MDIIQNFKDDFISLISKAGFEQEWFEKHIHAFEIFSDLFKVADIEVANSSIKKVIEVSDILLNAVSLGPYALAAYLLCEPYNKNIISKEEIINIYGENTFNIIIALKRISEIQTDKLQLQSENYRKFLLSVADDVRVVLIKIAERLYAMRNLFMYEDYEQLKQVVEADYIYAPLAHRLGLYNIKSEFEDLAMAYTHPAEYKDIVRKLEESSSRRETYINTFISPLRGVLDKYEIKYEIKWRTKSVSSIYLKMQKQGVDFSEVYDIFAIRIIISCPVDMEKSECWKAYSAVTDIYSPNPSRLRDWISIPKSNGYESLHTTVMGHEGRWVEVQIRTQRMDELAEKGLAAHWRYKGGKGERGLDRWFADIRDIIDSHEIEGEGLYEAVKHRLYSNEIFVYTPAGDLKRLPAGATVLDFAFDIHTNIGANAISAKVNSRSVPLRQVLNTGDKIEIITSKSRKVHQGWYKWVTTTKAKSAIRKVLNEEKFRLAGLGKEILERKLKNRKILFNDELIRSLLKHYNIKTANELYERIGKEEIDLSDIRDVIQNTEETPVVTDNEVISGGKQTIKKVFTSNTSLEISQAPDNIDYSYARCCNPIYGDSVVGFISVTGGIKIHRKSCPNLMQLASKYGYRIINVNWKKGNIDGSFMAQIIISGEDRIGILNDLTKVISTDLHTNMNSLEVQSDKGEFSGRISLTVQSAVQLEQLLKNLSKVKGVTKVVRAGNLPKT